MSIFANVFTGNSANDGTGTPLRTAFQIIDLNFANIANGSANISVNAPVQSVAGRTGNILLYVNDVFGAVSVPYINSLLAANLVVAKAYTDTQIATLVNSAPVVLDTLGQIATAIQNDESIIATLETLTYANANVAAYLTVNPQQGLYGNSNVASYLSINPQQGLYNNANVAAYLPTYTGNLTVGNIIFPSGTTITNQGTLIGGPTAVIANSTLKNQVYVQGAGVGIQTYDGVTYHTWLFNNSGSSSTPGNLAVGGNVIFPNGSYMGSAYGNTQVANYLLNYTGNIGGNISQLTNNNYHVTLQPQGYLTLPISQYGTAQMYSPGGVALYIGTQDSGNFWQFKPGGILTFPDNTSQTTAYPGLSILNSVNANVTAANVNIATLQTQVYSNANVATYLTVNSSQLSANLSAYQVLTTTTANKTYYPSFYDKTSGNGAAYASSALSFNPSNGTLTATTFSGAGTLTSLTTSGVSTLAGNVVLTSGSNSTNQYTGALVTTGTSGAGIGGNVNVGGQIFIGTGASGQGLSNALLVARGSSVSGSGAQYTQFALVNATNTGSTDFAGYPDNFTSDQAHGWVDMGIAGSTFNDPLYTITKSNDSYLFGSGVNGAGGNLVIATDYSGTNDIVIGVGSFFSNSEVARFHGNVGTHGYFNVQVPIRTVPTTVAGLPSASTVGAGARSFVTDATSTTFAALAVGSGSHAVPVYSDGTNWYIG